MDFIKQYWPWIVGAIIVLYFISRRNTRTVLAPQTSFTETPQVDPLAESRVSAFLSLIGLAGQQEESGTARKQIESTYNLALRELEFGRELGYREQDIRRELGLKGFDVDLSKTGGYLEALRQEMIYNFLTRQQDRMAQQGAIDRYYSSRTAGDIYGSINQALSNIFGGGGFGGGTPRTPPTFPTGGGGGYNIFSGFF